MPYLSARHLCRISQLENGTTKTRGRSVIMRERQGEGKRAKRRREERKMRDKMEKRKSTKQGG